METKEVVQVNLQSVHGYLKCRCAYCYNSRGFTQAGFKVNCLPLEIYHKMINRGWSRFGNYYCKIDIAHSCCKVFPLRIDITKFKMKRSHQRSLRKWKKFISGEDCQRNETRKDEETILETESPFDLVQNKWEVPEECELESKTSTPSKLLRTDSELEEKEKAIIQEGLNKFLVEESDIHLLDKALKLPDNVCINANNKCRQDIKLLKPASPKYGDYYTNLLLLLYSVNKENLDKYGVKDIKTFVNKIDRIVIQILQPLIGKIHINVQKNGYIGFTGYTSHSLKQKNNQEKTNNSGEQWFNILTPKLRSQSSGHQIKHQYKINKMNKKLINLNLQKHSSDQVSGLKDHLPQAHKKAKEIFDKVVQEQTVGVHGRKFEIRIEKPNFEREAFELYKKYCNFRHKGSNTDEKSYIQFMCMQALEYNQLDHKEKELRLGCYHMKYYLDGKLIAMGVLDILPTCLYSVYFFYDPDYKNLSLGVISILKEIEFMQEMQKYFPEFRYYHLGGYVQDSSKMAYKQEYQPAELLCPITYQWVAFNEKIKKMISKNQVKLGETNVKRINEMDFQGMDLEKFVKENVQINVRGAMRLPDLGEISPKYYIKVFKEVTMALGKDLTKIFEFGIYE